MIPPPKSYHHAGMASRRSPSPGTNTGGRTQYEPLPGDVMGDDLPASSEGHLHGPRDLRDTPWFINAWIRLFFM